MNFIERGIHMPDRKQPNDQQQRRNATGQIQEQLDRQADVIASIQATEQDQAQYVASAEKDEIE